MPRKEPTDFKTKLAKAKPAERTLLVCLNPSLIGAHEQLERELVTLTGDAADRLAPNPRARKIAQQMQALTQEMRDSEELFRLRSLNNLQYKELETAHPPRKNNRGDEAVGYNQDTFYPVLLRASIVEPEMDDDDFDQLLAVLTVRQFDELAAAAFMLSKGSIDVPFSGLASEILRNSGETSKPQPGSESARVDSGVGNPNGARRTATAGAPPAG